NRIGILAIASASGVALAPRGASRFASAPRVLPAPTQPGLPGAGNVGNVRFPVRTNSLGPFRPAHRLVRHAGRRQVIALGGLGSGRPNAGACSQRASHGSVPRTSRVATPTL